MMFIFNETTIDTFRMMGASLDVLNALADLADCFDAEGVFQIPDDIACRWDNARAALEKSLGSEVYSASGLDGDPDWLDRNPTCKRSLQVDKREGGGR